MLGAQGIFGGPGTEPGSRPGLQARERTGPLDELHGHRERELRGAARQGPGGPVGAPLTGIAKAYFRPGLRFGNLRLGPGTYRFQIVLTALTNPARTTALTSPTFRIGTPARLGHGTSHARPAALQGPPAREARLRQALSAPLTRRTGVR